MNFLLAFFVALSVHAIETDPNKMRVLQCMAVYEFDFVAEELGFSIAQVDDNGKEEEKPDDETIAKRRYDQTMRFLEEGKLTARPAAGNKKFVLKKDLARRCQILAETVIEIMVIKGQLEMINGKPRPSLLDHSL